MRRINAHDRQICVRVISDNVRIRMAAIGQNNFDSVCAVDDVAIGQDEPIRCENEPRAAALPPAIVPTHFDVHDRRADFLGGVHHCVGIGIQ